MDLPNVTPTREGIRLRCADITLLSALYSRRELTKAELIEEIRERNEGNHIVDNKATRQDLIKRKLNLRLSENIGRGYIEDSGNSFRITDRGQERLNSLQREIEVLEG